MSAIHLKLKYANGKTIVVDELENHIKSLSSLRECIETYMDEKDAYTIMYLDNEGDAVTVEDDAGVRASVAARAQTRAVTYHVVPAGAAFFCARPGRCKSKRAAAWAKRASACAGAEACFAKCASAAQDFAALSDDEKAAKLGGLATAFAEHLKESGLDGPAKWAAAAAEAFAAGAGAAEEASGAERVAVQESLETAAAGAPKPVAEPSGNTALGLDQVRIAVEESLATAAAEAAKPEAVATAAAEAAKPEAEGPAPAEESKEEPTGGESAESWEAVQPPKNDVIGALRCLEEMGFTSLAGVDACLGAVQKHTRADRSVDLNAAVADLVALIKG